MPLQKFLVKRIPDIIQDVPAIFRQLYFLDSEHRISIEKLEENDNQNDNQNDKQNDKQIRTLYSYQSFQRTSSTPISNFSYYRLAKKSNNIPLACIEWTVPISSDGQILGKIKCYKNPIISDVVICEIEGDIERERFPNWLGEDITHNTHYSESCLYLHIQEFK